MGNIKWYKRDVDAALVGMACLTLEERGAYNTILDLIYSREGNLLDDERTIARWMGCDVRVWRRIRLRLFEAGKLYVHAGKLRNGRSDTELHEAQKLITAKALRNLAAAQHRAKVQAQVKKMSNDYSAKIHYIYNSKKDKKKKQ